MTKQVYWSPLSFAQSLRVISWVWQWDIDKLINVNKTFLRICVENEDFLYDTHFYFNILSLAAKISARWLHCHKHGKCYSIVSCSPLILIILIGAHFLSLEISFQKHDEKTTVFRDQCVQEFGPWCSVCKIVHINTIKIMTALSLGKPKSFLTQEVPT